MCLVVFYACGACDTLFFYVSLVLSDLYALVVFFLMIRRPPRSTLDRSSAASDVYKRQVYGLAEATLAVTFPPVGAAPKTQHVECESLSPGPVSYTHLRAHETVLDIVCRLLLEKKKNQQLSR